MGKRRRAHQVAENAGENEEASCAHAVLGQVHELMPQVQVVPQKSDLTFDLEPAMAETSLSSTSACKCLLRPYFTVSSLSGAIRLDDSLPCP
jgi:hypothetical protein